MYAVACLLLAPTSGATTMVVEADEDIELVFPDRRVYIQVKTRSEPLGEADVANALQRFGRLREEHANGKRCGTARFVLVSNVAPGPKLLARSQGNNWFSDTTLTFPGKSPADQALPEAWLGIPEALSKCMELAASIPLCTLAPETLVLKLAATIMAGASGLAPCSDHAFQTDRCVALFEQIAMQLQEFPAPPPLYRPQADEPPLLTDAPIRLISGFSGAGKTAWVVQASLHSNFELAYFDIGDTSGSAVAIPLARELAGRFFGKGGGLGEILLPGATGLDMLRALSHKLKTAGMDVRVVIDNAHRADVDHLLSIVHATEGLRYLFLCQPGLVVSQIENTLGIAAETLRGWTMDTIAADAADAGCKVTPEAAGKLLGLTAGLPLYVTNAVRIAKNEYEGDLSAFCADLEKQTHTVITAQELILARVFGGLQSGVQDACAVLSICDLPLERTEITQLLKPVLSLDELAVARVIRELRSVGMIEIFGSNRVKLHDALRLSGRARLDALGAETRGRAYRALKSILLRSVWKDRDLTKLSLLVRVFAELGEVKLLVEMATDEIFHELGVVEQIYDTLDRDSQSEAIGLAERFTALDGLAFSDLKAGNLAKAKDHLDLMATIAKKHPLDDSDRLTLAMKQMLLAAAQNDGVGVKEKLEQAAALLPDNPAYQRIFRYNAAYALFKIGRYDECIEETERLIPEYYDVLGLEITDVLGKNPDKIWPCLDKGRDHTDDLKHLADCLDLQAQAMNRTRKFSPFGRIHAIKFYAMANALDSAVRVGQDLADEFVGRNDYIGARDVMERNVLPNVVGKKMMSYVVPVRAQYAVILAYCGDFRTAEQEMASLSPYESGLSTEAQKELHGQRALIARMRKIPPPPQWQMPTFHKPRFGPPHKMGRNEQCYCGSGLKYKRCHGRG